MTFPPSLESCEDACSAHTGVLGRLFEGERWRWRGLGLRALEAWADAPEELRGPLAARRAQAWWLAGIDDAARALLGRAPSEDPEVPVARALVERDTRGLEVLAQERALSAWWLLSRAAEIAREGSRPDEAARLLEAAHHQAREPWARTETALSLAVTHALAGRPDRARRTLEGLAPPAELARSASVVHRLVVGAGPLEGTGPWARAAQHSLSFDPRPLALQARLLGGEGALAAAAACVARLAELRDHALSAGGVEAFDEAVRESG